MSTGLFLFSRDAAFVEQLRAGLAGRFDLIVADRLDPETAAPGRGRVQAALAHLAPGVLNGYSARQFMDKLKAVVPSAPIYGLVDPACPAELRDEAARSAAECLALPIDYARLEQMLAAGGSVESELAACFRELPHRELRGQTRSLVTFTPSMFEMFDELQVAASHDVTILLIGETGSGKTHLARMIHELSPRAGERCLTVACGALPPDLIESELFGYVRGAFTGADADKPGKFAAAEQGSLLLDEIDVLSPEQQAKLLRVIETGEYEPVGSNDTQISTARLIAASNIDLEKLVAAGRFRMDLYYRLNTLSFHLPPLRERPWDIEFLARKFVIEHANSHRIRLRRITPEFLTALREYQWPGNIRELENVTRRAVLYCRDGVLSVSDLPSAVRRGGPRPPEPRDNGRHGTNGGGGSARRGVTLEDRVEEIERRIIEESLQRHNFHRADTARELGISRVTLYNKMKKFGMMT